MSLDDKEIKLSFFSKLLIGEEKDFFIENLAILLDSGMDVLAALSAIRSEVRTKQMKKIIDSLSEDIDAGSYIWRALDKIGLMPDQVISLIRIGEEAGRLPENLKVIVLQQQKERAFRSKIHSAMMYPVIVVSLTVVVGVGITWFILPKLTTVFNSLNMELPLITKVLIAVGNFLGKYGYFAVPLFLVALATIFYFTFIFKKTKFIGQYIVLRTPVIKKLIQQVELARFGFILGTLLKAGLPIVQAVGSLGQATTLHVYKKFYSHLQNAIEEGNSFQKSFTIFPSINKLIPSTIQQMIAAGEQSGRLSETLIKVGKTYDEKTETTTKNLTVVLEPILLIIIWVGVVSIALAVILPIYSLVGGFNKGSQSSSPPPPPPVVEESIIIDTQVVEDGSVATTTIDQDIATTTQEIATSTEEITATSTLISSYWSRLGSPQSLEIITTGTGYFNVRDQPSLTGEIVNKAKPGEIYYYINKEEDWYEIILADGETGWVIDRYVETIDN